MAIVKKGTFLVTTTGAAQNLNLGFIPSYFKAWCKTKIIANTNGIQWFEWFDDMANASAYVYTTTTGVPTLTYLSTNGITPYVQTVGTEWISLTGLPPSAVSTNLTVTGVSKAANASITATHAFTAADIGVTWVTFHNIVGMTQMNTLSGLITGVTATTSFTVNINSTGFTTYASGGLANVITGTPPTTTVGTQVFNTPLKNVGFTGITMGTTLMVTGANEFQYLAVLDSDITSY